MEAVFQIFYVTVLPSSRVYLRTEQGVHGMPLSGRPALQATLGEAMDAIYQTNMTASQYQINMADVQYRLHLDDLGERGVSSSRPVDPLEAAANQTFEPALSGEQLLMMELSEDGYGAGIIRATV